MTNYNMPVASPPAVTEKQQRSKRGNVIRLILGVVAILAGYVTAYTGVVVANGLGQGPSQASGECSALSLHTSACHEFSTTAGVGEFLLLAGVVWVIIEAIVLMVRYYRTGKVT